MGLGKHGGIIYFNIPDAVATGVFHIRRPRTAITGHASGQTLIPNSLGRRMLHIGRQETRRTREPVRENIQPETQNYTEDESKQEKRTDDRRHGIDCVDDTGRPDGSGPRDRSRQDDLALCRQGNGQPLHGPLCGRSVPGNERALSDIRFRRRVRRRRARQSGLCSLFRIFRTQGVCRRIDRLSARTARDGRKPPRPGRYARSARRTVLRSGRYGRRGSVRRHVLHRRTGPGMGPRPLGRRSQRIKRRGDYGPAGRIRTMHGLGAEPPPARRLPLCRHHRLRRSRFGEKLLRSGLAGKTRPDPAISRRCGL